LPTYMQEVRNCPSIFESSTTAADDFTGVWVSQSEIQGLWEGARQLSTRRASGVDPKGGRQGPFPVGKLEGPVDWG